MSKVLIAKTLKPVCDMYAMLSKTIAILMVPKILAIFTFGRISLNSQFLLFLN